MDPISGEEVGFWGVGRTSGGDVGTSGGDVVENLHLNIPLSFYRIPLPIAEVRTPNCLPFTLLTFHTLDTKTRQS